MDYGTREIGFVCFTFLCPSIRFLMVMSQKFRGPFDFTPKKLAEVIVLIAVAKYKRPTVLFLSPVRILHFLFR